jgi:hypothetical protein
VNLYWTVFLLIAITFTGCATPHRKPRLSSYKAVELADANVRRTGDNLERFQPRIANYDVERGAWIVTYLDKRNGGGFELAVDDKTEKTRVTIIDVWPVD